MKSIKTIEVVSAHAEGEVGDVIVKGVDPPPGETIWEQSRWVAKDKVLRNFILNEPRGGVFRHVNLLVPPKDPKAAAALGSFGGTIRFTCLKTPPLGSFSIKLRKTLSFAIHLLCSHIVSPGGGSTPFTITSPTSPSACADTT